MKLFAKSVFVGATATFGVVLLAFVLGLVHREVRMKHPSPVQPAPASNDDVTVQTTEEIISITDVTTDVPWYVLVAALLAFIGGFGWLFRRGGVAPSHPVLRTQGKYKAIQTDRSECRATRNTLVKLVLPERVEPSLKGGDLLVPLNPFRVRSPSRRGGSLIGVEHD